MYQLSKELKNLLRHQRTWWLLSITFFVPLIGFFLLFRFTGQVISAQTDTEKRDIYKIAWIAKEGQATLLHRKLKLHRRVNLLDNLQESQLQSELEKDSIALGIVISPDFDSALVYGRKAKITLHYLQSRGVVTLVEKMISDIQKGVVRQRLDSLGLAADMVSPIDVSERNYFDLQALINAQFKRLQGAVSGLLALLLLIFGAIGARYGLRRIFWMEMEDGTISLLRSTAVSPFRLFSSKSIMVALFAWVSMGLAVLGFALALSFEQEGIMQSLITQFRDLATWGNLCLLIFSALPFALLLSQSWAFWGLVAKGFWAGFLSNIFMLLLLLFFLAAMVAVPVFNSFTAVLPYLNYVFLCFGILTSTYTFFNLLMAWLLTLLLALLLGSLNLGRWKRIG